VVALVVLSGCAPAVAPTATGPAGVSYREDPDLQRVWLADGFVFKGYEAVHVEETRTDVRSSARRS
jgi:hypothetical protein